MARRLDVGVARCQQLDMQTSKEPSLDMQTTANMFAASCMLGAMCQGPLRLRARQPSAEMPDSSTAPTIPLTPVVKTEANHRMNICKDA